MLEPIVIAPVQGWAVVALRDAVLLARTYLRGARKEEGPGDVSCAGVALYSLREQKVVGEREIHCARALFTVLHGAAVREVGEGSADVALLFSHATHTPFPPPESPRTSLYAARLSVTPASVTVRRVTEIRVFGLRVHDVAIHYPLALVTTYYYYKDHKGAASVVNLETGERLAERRELPYFPQLKFAWYSGELWVGSIGCRLCIFDVQLREIRCTREDRNYCVNSIGVLRGGPWDGSVVTVRGSHWAHEWGSFITFYRRPLDRPALVWHVRARDYEKPLASVLPLEWDGDSYVFLARLAGAVRRNGVWADTTRLLLARLSERGVQHVWEREYGGDFEPNFAYFDETAGGLVVVMSGVRPFARLALLRYGPRGDWRVSLGEPRYALAARPSPVRPSPTYPSPPTPPGAPAAPRLPAWAVPAAAGTAAAALGALLFKRILPAR